MCFSPKTLAIQGKGEKELAGPVRPNLSVLKKWRLVFEHDSHKMLEVDERDRLWERMGLIGRRLRASLPSVRVLSTQGESKMAGASWGKGSGRTLGFLTSALLQSRPEFVTP